MVFSQAGNMANKVNGKASAMAKPNMPMVGARMLPDVETSTRRKPMIGPVQEKDTKASVKAIRKMLKRPVVASALLSTALLHDEGKVISNAPKKLAANTSSNRQKKMLKMALVESAFKALAPKMAVMTKPNST